MEGKDIITKEYLEGKPVIKIAEEYGLSREAIYQRLRKLPNWQEVQRHRKEKDKGKVWEQRHRVIERRKWGWSMVRISQDLNIPVYKIRKMLLDTKYDRSKKYYVKRNRHIIYLWNKGYTKYKIAKEIGCNWSAVNLVIKRYEKRQRQGKRV